MVLLLGIGIWLGLIHLIYWLLVKGVIFVMWNLFQINWYNKFWVVYLFLFLIGIIFKGLITVNKKGD